MTSEASELAKQVFMNYREQSALFQIDYKDEEDLLLEKLGFDDDDLESNSISLSSNSQKIGPRDTLIKEAVTLLESLGDGRFRVEIREMIRFRPPRTFEN